jgi:hypothetical protein
LPKKQEKEGEDQSICCQKKMSDDQEVGDLSNTRPSGVMYTTTVLTCHVAAADDPGHFVLKSLFPGDAAQTSVRIKKTYRQFLDLRARLTRFHGPHGVIVPPVPYEESVLKSSPLNSMLQSFFSSYSHPRLVHLLQDFISSCTSHPVLSQSPLLLAWLGDTRVAVDEQQIPVMLHEQFAAMGSGRLLHQEALQEALSLAELQHIQAFRQDHRMPAWLADAGMFTRAAQASLTSISAQLVHLSNKKQVGEMVGSWRSVGNALSEIADLPMCPPSLELMVRQHAQRMVVQSSVDEIVTFGETIEDDVRFISMYLGAARDLIDHEWKPELLTWERGFALDWSRFIVYFEERFTDILTRMERFKALQAGTHNTGSNA